MVKILIFAISAVGFALLTAATAAFHAYKGAFQQRLSEKTRELA